MSFEQLLGMPGGERGMMSGAWLIRNQELCFLRAIGFEKKKKIVGQPWTLVLNTSQHIHGFYLSPLQAISRHIHISTN